MSRTSGRDPRDKFARKRIFPSAGVAQSVEHLICNQRVGGSNPFASSRNELGSEHKARNVRQVADSVVAAQQVFPKRTPFGTFPASSILRGSWARPWFPCIAKLSLWKLVLCCVLSAGCEVAPASFRRGLRDEALNRQPRPKGFAQVGEWLKPTDCKSVPPSEVRRFESFPVHQDFL